MDRQTPLSVTADPRGRAGKETPRGGLDFELLAILPAHPATPMPHAPFSTLLLVWLFLREISFLARRLDYTKGRQGGGLRGCEPCEVAPTNALQTRGVRSRCSPTTRAHREG